jgi:hypothetical protein
MAKNRLRDVHRDGCGDAADNGIPDIFDHLVLFFKRAAGNEVNGSLRVGRCMNDKAVILFELGNPGLNIRAGVAVGVLVGDSGDSANKGRSHLRYQFLISETVAKGAM